MLGERVGPREIGAVAAIIVGVTAIALADPQRGEDAAPGLAFLLVAGALALLALSAFIPARAALGRRRPARRGDRRRHARRARPPRRRRGRCPTLLPALGWCLLAAGGGIAAVAAESAVLQRRGAARVAPIVLAGQVAVPVALAPLVIGERWGDAPLLVCGLALVIAGSALLAASAGVGRLALGQPEHEVGGGG